MSIIKKITVLISLIFFSNISFLMEGIAVIDYNAIFLGTDLARERIDDLRDSSDYKDLTDEVQAKEQEVTQKLQADQAEIVQKVVNELIKAKKIKMLLNSQALLAFDRTDEKINLTPEVVDLINKERK